MVDESRSNKGYNLGGIYRNLERYDEAIDAYLQALRINPEYADAWNNLGVAHAYDRLERNDEAIDAYRQVLSINPEYAAAWFNLGLNYSVRGNETAALEAVKELRRFDPERADELLDFISRGR